MESNSKSLKSLVILLPQDYSLLVSGWGGKQELPECSVLADLFALGSLGGWHYTVLRCGTLDEAWKRENRDIVVG